MGVRDVKGRAQIAVERLHFSKCESIIQRSERRFRKTLGNEGQHRWRFGQNSARRYHCRNARLWVDFEIIGRLLFRPGKVYAPQFVLGSGVLECNIVASEQVLKA